MMGEFGFPDQMITPAAHNSVTLFQGVGNAVGLVVLFVVFAAWCRMAFWVGSGR